MKQIDYAAVGGRLDFCIREKGLTERELARRTGMDVETISHWVHGKYNIQRLDYIRAVCKELDIKPSWLLYGRIGE